MPTISSASLVTRNPDLVAANIDGDVVMMSIEQGEYYGITGVGSRAWELLASPIAVVDIARVICAEYDTDEVTCLADMQSFVEELLQLGLVSVVKQ
ncbi:PqqD family peptide modification chaperone [Litchfieldella anticariensis]|nr:PqqD family peptide modification chaperone [Halomonas anticariensis]